MTHVLMGEQRLKHGTMSSVLMNLISELQAVEHGQLIDKSRVIDHLLDLRSAAADSPLVLASIDGLLASAPGRSMVESSWWVLALRDLSETRQLTTH